MISYLNKDGSYIADYTEIYDWKSIGKAVRIDDEHGNIKRERFYLKLASGSLIDARVKSLHELKNLMSTQYKEVDRNIFDLYVKYLKSETHVSLRSIERLLENL